MGKRVSAACRWSHFGVLGSPDGLSGLLVCFGVVLGVVLGVLVVLVVMVLMVVLSLLGDLRGFESASTASSIVVITAIWFLFRLANPHCRTNIALQKFIVLTISFRCVCWPELVRNQQLQQLGSDFARAGFQCL